MYVCMYSLFRTVVVVTVAYNPGVETGQTTSEFVRKLDRMHVSPPATPLFGVVV